MLYELLLSILQNKNFGRKVLAFTPEPNFIEHWERPATERNPKT